MKLFLSFLILLFIITFTSGSKEIVISDTITSLGNSMCMVIDNRYPIPFNYTLQLYRDGEAIGMCTGEEWCHLEGDSFSMNDFYLEYKNDYYGQKVYLVVDDHTCPGKTFYIVFFSLLLLLLIILTVGLIVYLRHKYSDDRFVNGIVDIV